MIEMECISNLCQRLGLGTLATPFAARCGGRGAQRVDFQEFFERLPQAKHRERQQRGGLQTAQHDRSARTTSLAYAVSRFSEDKYAVTSAPNDISPKLGRS